MKERLYYILLNIIRKLEQSINVERITNNEIDTLFGSASGTGTDAQDYVVEHGTDGIWKYRKWASGIAECWGETSSTVTTWSAWGSLYEGSPYPTDIAFPSGLFITKPQVCVNVYLTNSVVGGVMWEMGTVLASSIKYIIPIRPNAGASSLPYSYSMNCKGKWK